MCWMTVMWWSLLTCPWKQSQKKYRTAGISRCTRCRYRADLLVSLVVLLQCMYAMMPACAHLSVCVCVCVCVYTELGSLMPTCLHAFKGLCTPDLCSGHTDGMRSCISVVSLSPSQRLFLNFVAFAKTHLQLCWRAGGAS